MEKLSRTQKLENLKSNVNEAEANQGFDFYNNQPLTGATAANQAPQFTQPMTNDSQQIFNPFATQTQPLVQQAPQAPSFVDPFAAPLQQQNVVPQFQNVEQQFGQQPVVNNQFSPYGPLAANQVTSAPTDFMSVPQAPQPTYTNQPLPPQQPFAGTDMFNQTANTVPPLGQFQVPPVAGNDSSYIDQVLREAKLNSIAQGERTAEDTNVNIIEE